MNGDSDGEIIIAWCDGAANGAFFRIMMYRIESGKTGTWMVNACINNIMSPFHFDYRT